MCLSFERDDDDDGDKNQRWFDDDKGDGTDAAR